MNDLIIDSKYVGVPWKQVIKEVTWRMTTNYAAAIGDENLLYFDDESEADLPARSRAGSDQAVWSSEVKIAKTLPYVYDGCTDIVFEIHTSPAYAHSVGLPDIVVQGTASLALSVREIVSKELGGDPRGICAIGARFTGMVFAGNTVSVELLERREAPAGTELFFRTKNKDTGKVAVSDGYIKIG